MEELNDTYISVLRGHLPLVSAAEEVPWVTPLKELGLNSLKAVDLLLDLEDAFDVAFPDSALTDENFYSAATLLAVLRDVMDLKSAGVASE